MKKIALLLSNIALSSVAMAQISLTGSNPFYNQDFNALDITNVSSSNLPLGWSIFEYGTSANANNQYKGDAGTGASGDTYSYGVSNATERALGSLASNTLSTMYGATFINNTGGTITGLTITYTGEQWRFGSTGRTNVDSLRFLYSIVATSVSDTTSANWTEDLTLLFTSPNISGTAGSLDGNLTTNQTSKTGTIPLNVSIGGTFIIKWWDKNIVGIDDGLAIDDISISFTTSTPPTPTYPPTIVSTTPADNANNVSIATNSISITFDRQVSTTNGTGSLIISNETDQTTQTYTLPSSDITVNGYTATIANVVLAQSKVYHVTFDSTMFDTAGFIGVGIYDTTAWNFSTTTITPPPPPDTFLNESFDVSCPTGLPTRWSKFSVAGSQEWNCHSFGYNNTPAFYMNGYQNGNNVNEDWLITPQLDLSAIPNAHLYFRAFKKFVGDDIKVLVSNNYNGSSDPSVSTFVWNDLGVNFSNIDTNWNIYTAYLNNYTSTPLHIAFKYTSTAVDGAQWKIDDVEAKSFIMNVVHTNKQSLEFWVLGKASQNEFTLGCNLKAGNYHLSIYDLAGIQVFVESLSISTGIQQKTISGFNLTRGMYIIKLDNRKEFGTLKLIVE